MAFPKKIFGVAAGTALVIFLIAALVVIGLGAQTIVQATIEGVHTIPDFLLQKNDVAKDAPLLLGKTAGVEWAAYPYICTTCGGSFWIPRFYVWDAQAAGPSVKGYEIAVEVVTGDGKTSPGSTLHVDEQTPASGFANSFDLPAGEAQTVTVIQKVYAIPASADAQKTLIATDNLVFEFTRTQIQEGGIPVTATTTGPATTEAPASTIPAPTGDLNPELSLNSSAGDVIAALTGTSTPASTSTGVSCGALPTPAAAASASPTAALPLLSGGVVLGILLIGVIGIFVLLARRRR